MKSFHQRNLQCPFHRGIFKRPCTFRWIKYPICKTQLGMSDTIQSLLAKRWTIQGVLPDDRRQSSGAIMTSSFFFIVFRTYATRALIITQYNSNNIIARHFRVVQPHTWGLTSCTNVTQKHHNKILCKKVQLSFHQQVSMMHTHVGPRKAIYKIYTKRWLKDKIK